MLISSPPKENVNMSEISQIQSNKIKTKKSKKKICKIQQFYDILNKTFRISFSSVFSVTVN